jgi:hypothetical protein
MQENALVVDCLQKNEQSSKLDYSARRLDLIRAGNWCGHDPDLPRFFAIPEVHKARPKILTWAMDAWRRFYTLPTSYFPELRIYRESSRQQRTESREAVSSIAQVLLHYTELASLRVGVPHVTNGFRSLTIEFLAEKAGLGVKRAQRAIAVLKRAGYLKLIERFDTLDVSPGEAPKFIGLAAVKCLTIGFFKACGINLQWLSAQRRLARKRINKRLNNHAQTLQESAASVIDINSLIAAQGNSKAHIDLMRAFLKDDQKKELYLYDKELKRKRSLEQLSEPDE